MICVPSVTLLCIDCVDVSRAIFAIERCESAFQFGAVKLLTSLPTLYSRAVSIDVLSNLNSYSRFMLCQVHEFVATPHMLIVQHDGFIVNPVLWNPAFLMYDYIGAPWFDGAVGNGGFSLRSKLLMAHVARLCRQMPGAPAAIVQDQEGKRVGVTNEDAVICRGLRPQLEQAGFAFAPPSIAAQFSTEDRSQVTRSLGIHGPLAVRRWKEMTS